MGQYGGLSGTIEPRREVNAFAYMWHGIFLRSKYIFLLHMENIEIINEKQGLSPRRELVPFFVA